MAPVQSPERLQLDRLLEASQSMMRALDHELVLDELLDAAREVTGARYAALGVLDETGERFSRFIASGMTAGEQAGLGAPPSGHGVFGTVIRAMSPVRVGDVATHPDSWGFPNGHPPMSSFLGVPVLRGGDAWGVIYCAEQSGGAFTAEHEQLLVLLSGWASIAVQNAELYARSQADRDELEHALLAYRAAREVAQAIGSDLELGHVLELISERCRPLVRASTVLVLPGDALTDPVGIVEQLSDEERAHWSALGASNPSSALLVPMLYRGTPVGVLAAFREAGSEPFTIADQELLESYAASAATRITISRSVRRERLNDAVAAADAERLRWARELHDQTLQGLAGLRLLLTSGGKEIADQAVAIIDEEIASLRAIVADLRPPSLESEGWSGALEALVARQRRPGGPKITLTVDPQTEEAPPDILAEAFRIVQEALTNALRHAAASVVSIDVSCAAHQLAVCVRDDGRGFDPSEPGGGGMGLVGMRERVELAGGTLEVRSGADGTSVVVLLGARGSAIESS